MKTKFSNRLVLKERRLPQTSPGDLANLELPGDQNETCNAKVMDGPENPEDFHDNNYYLSLREIETIDPQKTFILNDDYGII